MGQRPRRLTLLVRAVRTVRPPMNVVRTLSFNSRMTMLVDMALLVAVRSAEAGARANGDPSPAIINR